MSRHHHQQPCQQLLDLLPLYPLPLGRRVRTVVGGQYCRVLERISAVLSAPSYILHRIVYQHPHNGVVVFLASTATATTNSLSGTLVGIKAIPIPMPTSTATDQLYYQEVGAMQRLQQSSNHPHVIPLIDCLQDHHYMFLVLPYMSGGDLFARVEASGGQGLSGVQAAHYLRQVCQGLLFMKQSSRLAHHDVSLENIMFTDSQQDVVQIIDMGMCLGVPKDAVVTGHQSVYLIPQSCGGKFIYVAPEVVREEAYDPFAADVWSLGVCLYMMLTCRPIYTSRTDPTFQFVSYPGGVQKVLDTDETNGIVLPVCAKELICCMLHADPTERITLEEVLLHPFLELSSRSPTQKKAS